jgi:hypothetical protein
MFYSTEVLPEESDEEENMEVSEAATTCCLKRMLKNVLFNVTYGLG